MISNSRRLIAALCVAVFVAIGAAILPQVPANATPSYANATGLGCASCHNAGPPNRSNLTTTGLDFQRCGHVLNCAPPPQVTTSAPQYGQAYSNTYGQQAPATFNISKVWFVQVRQADGKFMDGVWTRQGSSGRFDALWLLDGNVLTDTITYQNYQNGLVALTSSKMSVQFVGSPTSDGNRVFNGSFVGSNASSTDRWSASIW